ncbi:hypothetical protein DPEC_G00246380 [Dallia pectoralis]|uniref:Uncharacterized protein n=1 Tax=Dallia pectoralis TaxID=75939 RepID=A0ACC2FWD5_DALPE|nr:hypothetical protein DPEC_G00246380 [Dallia pectoralis]
MWCGDFNVHSALWGGERTDRNGQVIEALIEGRGLVCLNDGRGTRMDMRIGKESVLDLTLVSSEVAGTSEWEVARQRTVGSDHYPIVCVVGQRDKEGVEEGLGRWVFSKADWVRFQVMSERGLKSGVEAGGEVEHR